ncbi:hypothetical protein [Candidatus Agathobaculum pullicola]|uniref:hypothetical protein n=1 Tax=Candidatus Agathobaculum pullicola TaxID=2838426 RepID=UPI003F912DB0
MLKAAVIGPFVSVNVDAKTGIEFEGDLIELLAALYNTYGRIGDGNVLLSWVGRVCADGTVLETAKRQEGGEVK